VPDNYGERGRAGRNDPRLNDSRHCGIIGRRNAYCAKIIPLKAYLVSLCGEDLVNLD